MHQGHASVFDSHLWFDLARIVVQWGLGNDSSSFFRIGVEDISHERIALHMPFFGFQLTFILPEPWSNANTGCTCVDNGHRAFEKLFYGLRNSFDVLPNIILMQHIVCLVR